MNGSRLAEIGYTKNNVIAGAGGLELRQMKSELRVQVVDDEIIVTRPGSHYSVTYYKLPTSPGLLAKRMPENDDLRISMTAAEFLAAAWKLANEKARALGWI